MAIAKVKNMMDLVPRLEEKYFPKPVPARVENLRKQREQGIPERLERKTDDPRIESVKDKRSADKAAGTAEACEFGRKLGRELRKVEGADRASDTAPTRETVKTEGSAEAADPKTLDEVEKAIKAQTNRVCNLLKKLGIDISPETAQTNALIRRVLKIAGEFLAAATQEGAQKIQVTLSGALESLKDLSIQIEVKPDEVNSLFQELSAGLTALQSLLALKEKLLQGNELTVEEQALLEALSANGSVENLIPASETMETVPENALPAEDAAVPATGDAPVEETAPETETAPVNPMLVKAVPVPEQAAGAETAEAAAVTPEAKTVETKPQAPVTATPALEAQPAVQELPAAAAVQAQVLPKKEKNGKTQESQTAEKPVLTVNLESKPAEAVQVKAEVDAGTADAGQRTLNNEFTFTSGQEQTEAASIELPSIESTEPTPETAPVAEKNLFIKTLADLRDAVANPQGQIRPAATLFEAPVQQTRTPSQDHPVTEKNVVQQITSKFQLFTGQHGSEIRIQLKPEHLGQVKISIEIDREVVVTRMEVESEKVRHIVENNVQSLKNALEEQGIKVERFEVTVNQGREDFFRRDTDMTQRRGQGRVRVTTHGPAKGGIDGIDGAEAAETGRRYGWNTVEYVG